MQLDVLREGMTMDEIHRAGARRFGAAWLSANRTVLESVRAIGMEPGDFSIETKTMLSAIAFGICIRRVQEGAGDELG